MAVNNEGIRVSDSYSSDSSSYVQCAFPGCGHQGEIITKLHCRINHGMERDEITRLYGMPTIVGRKSGFLGIKHAPDRYYSQSKGSFYM